MMCPSEIEELARQPKESEPALGARLIDLRSRGAGIIECIKYTMLNQRCSLAEATTIVVNSHAWADRKDDFLRQQEEAFEEFLADNQNRIEAIQTTMTPHGTNVVVQMKSPVGPQVTTAEPGVPPDCGGIK